MSSVSIRLDGDVDALLAKLQSMQNIDKAGVMRAIAEGLRTSTNERFSDQESPDGKAWEPSIRARREGGKSLIRSTGLRTSIHAEADETGAAVGTNLVYAATHQFGDTRTIRAKKGKYLKFQIGGHYVSVPSVNVSIPARPYLGVSKSDEEEIKEILDEVFKE